MPNIDVILYQFYSENLNVTLLYGSKLPPHKKRGPKLNSCKAQHRQSEALNWLAETKYRLPEAHDPLPEWQKKSNYSSLNSSTKNPPIETQLWPQIETQSSMLRFSIEPLIENQASIKQPYFRTPNPNNPSHRDSVVPQNNNSIQHVTLLNGAPKENQASNKPPYFRTSNPDTTNIETP